MNKFTKIITSIVLGCTFLQAQWIGDTLAVLDKQQKASGIATKTLSLRDYTNAMGNYVYLTYENRITKENIDYMLKEMREFCEYGLIEACGEYGYNLVAGFYGTKQDVEKGISHLAYAAKSVKQEMYKLQTQTLLEMANRIKPYDEKDRIKAISSDYWNNYQGCVSKKGDELSCFRAMIYLKTVPADIRDDRGFSEDDIIKNIVVADTQRLGQKDSYVFKLYDTVAFYHKERSKR